MRALSLTEPWATLVAIGAKRYETRSWGTTYRGPLMIHASKGFPKDCRDLCHEEPFRSALRPVRLEGFALGHLLAVVNLTDCIRITATNAPTGDEFAFGDYTPGRFMWRLEDAQRLPQRVACRGSLGLWQVTVTAAPETT